MYVERIFIRMCNYVYCLWLQASTPMQTIIDALAEKQPGKTESRASHPVVVALGSRGNLQQVFLAVEGEIVPILRRAVISGVDRMMKAYFVLNMQYPDESSHLLHFLQKVIYGVPDDLPLSRGASDLALFIKKKGSTVTTDETQSLTNLLMCAQSHAVVSACAVKYANILAFTFCGCLRLRHPAVLVGCFGFCIVCEIVKHVC